ncbi:unnamed protein product, partial [Orchesella dallaii]
GYGGTKTHLFKPSPKTAEKWKAILQKLRSDKVFNPDAKSHKLCELHFKESDVVKFIGNGEEVHLQRQHWKLKPEAIPCHFPNIRKYLQPKIVKQRRVVKRKCSLDTDTRSYKRRKRDVTPN